MGTVFVGLREEVLRWALVFLIGLGQPAPGGAEATDLIAFLREDGIWLVNSDGAGLRRVFAIPTYTFREEKGQRLHGAERLSCAPAWSPSGTRLCFGDNQEERLIVIDLQGKVIKKLPRLPDRLWPTTPAERAEIAAFRRSEGYEPISLWMSFQRILWTADGSRIVYEYHEEDLCGITLVVVWDGQEHRVLGRPGYSLDLGNLSADGRWVCYAEEKGGREPSYAVYLEDLQTGQRRQVYSDVQYPAYDPMLSPDGRWIVFLRCLYWEDSEAGKEDYAVTGLWRVDSEGQRLERLTRGDDGEVAWAPDSLRFSYGYESGTAIFYLADHTVLHTISDKTYEAWTRDGRSLIGAGLWRVDQNPFHWETKQLAPDGWHPSLYGGRSWRPASGSER